jgi:hypothetical protein
MNVPPNENPAIVFAYLPLDLGSQAVAGTLLPSRPNTSGGAAGNTARSARRDHLV